MQVLKSIVQEMFSANCEVFYFAGLLFLAAGLCGVVLHALAIRRLRAHFKHSFRKGMGEMAPVTFWRAIKSDTPSLQEKLEGLVQGMRARDQVLLGVDRGSMEVEICRVLQQKFPDRVITLVECEASKAANPKIFKFLQMEPYALHPRWLLADSEAILDSTLLENILCEWMEHKEDVLTMGYRFMNLDTWTQRLDAGAVLLTLWPGLMLVGKMRFTLGACTAIRAEDIRKVGGWKRFGDELAEDHALGKALAAQGRNIVLSKYIIPLDSDLQSLLGYLRHQHRIAVTYRAANPAGAIGLPLLHVTPSWLALLLLPGWWKTGALLLIVCRWVQARKVAKLLGWDFPSLAWVCLWTPLVETGCWFAAWFSRKVWWRGKWRKITWRGKFRDQAPEI